MAEGGDLKPPTPASTPHSQMPPLPGIRYETIAPSSTTLGASCEREVASGSLLQMAGDLTTPFGGAPWLCSSDSGSQQRCWLHICVRIIITLGIGPEDSIVEGQFFMPLLEEHGCGPSRG